MIKKRIKMQLKKAVSTFAGTALSGILCAVLLTGCGTLQNGEMPLPAESETSRSNDQTEEKTKGEDAEDGEITGSTEKTDDTEETKTSGTGKTVPEIWNREWPSNVDLPSSYDYREHERAPKIGNQGFLGTCWAFASLTALESTLLPKQKETFSVDHMSMHNHFLLGRPCMGVGRSLWRWFLARWFKSQGTCPGDTDTAVKRLRSDQKSSLSGRRCAKFPLYVHAGL